jgi:hypothetical protein
MRRVTNREKANDQERLNTHVHQKARNRNNMSSDMSRARNRSNNQSSDSRCKIRQRQNDVSKLTNGVRITTRDDKL